jgi:hypothetical protein
VAPTRVVTSGSCTGSGGDVYVLANTKELADEAGGSLSQATDVQLAPGWEAGTAIDVAVLTISPAPDPATPIQLLDENESGDFPAPATALIAGWGATSDSGDASTLLRQGQVTLTGCSATPVRCSTTTTEPCSGDSGGPAIVQLGADTLSADPSPSNGTWRLVAMPGTYTFKVRAVSLGGVGATPAKKRFTIR